MPDLPSGTVTFLFTDIEGSTALWERDREAMATAVARHLALLDAEIAAHGGVHFKTVGDAAQVAFATAPDAVAAALAAQQSLVAEDWGAIGGLRVRMAVHAGEAEPDPRGDYLSAPLNRLSRLLATGHGGQILLSQTVQQLVRGALPAGAELRDLGEHRLRDLLEPERVYQLVHPDLPAEFPPLRSLEARPHNLPLQPTAFLGREREVRDVVTLVGRPDVRLLTLTGPGGTGKTRLALQVAADLVDDFADGVFFVPLAALTDPALVPSAIASALGIREEGERSLGDRLREVLVAQQVLLVLDNVEHVIDAAPPIGEVLTTSPGLKVLATSRVPLRLRAEREYPVPPLALPRRVPPPSVEQLAQYEAVRLFISRAQAVKPDFAVDNANAPAVAEICCRLDGLPLAIELAAARVRMLPPQALLARLEKRLPLLTGGARDAPARQRTLRDTIAWSYALLDQSDQILFRRLAVFAGGCTLEAAEAVGNHDTTLDTLGGVERLCEHSLLRQEAGPGSDPRFAMLETVREYGLERLAESREEEVTRDAHAVYFAVLGHHVEHDFMRRPSAVMATLAPEVDNLRTALDWSTRRRDAEHGLYLGLAFGTLGTLGQSGGMLTEARGWLERVLALPGGDSLLRARSHQLLGRIAIFQGETDAGEAAGRQALELAGAERWIRVMALNLLGIAELDRGPSDTAQQWFEQALALAESHPETAPWVPLLLTHLGLVAGLRHDFAAARQRFDAALAALPPDGMEIVRETALSNLAWVLHELGERAPSAAVLRESLRLQRELGDVLLLNVTFDDAARHALDAARPNVAARLLGAGEALRKRGGVVIPPFNLEFYQTMVARAREALGETTFAAAWELGAGLPLDQAVAEADAMLAAVAAGVAGTGISGE